MDAKVARHQLDCPSIGVHRSVHLEKCDLSLLFFEIRYGPHFSMKTTGYCHRPVDLGGVTAARMHLPLFARVSGLLG